MTDHTLDVRFVVSASCSNGNCQRDRRIIEHMALAVCAPGTSPEAIPPSVLSSATDLYLMITAMRLALEREAQETTRIIHD